MDGYSHFEKGIPEVQDLSSFLKGSPMFFIILQALHFENCVKECLHNISQQREKIPVFQRVKALRSAFVLWDVKVERGDLYGS